MSSNEYDAFENAMSPRQITDFLIMLLDHAARNELVGLEAGLGSALEALMEDLQNKDRASPLSQTNSGANIVDFNDARHRMVREARAGAPVWKTSPTPPLWT